MDEEKKIMEKRSSFRGWKERNKGKMQLKRNTIGILIIISILLATVTYPYWNKLNKVGGNSSPAQNKTPTPIKDIKSNSSPPLKTPNTTSIPKKNIVGNVGFPLISNGGFEINVTRVNMADFRTTVWIIVRNKDDYEKPFKLLPGTIILDNIGQQYENVRVTRSAEISQTNLSAQAMREGAIFFENLQQGRSLKKLILNINNDKVEFLFNSSNN